MLVFINEAITNGIDAYIAKKQTSESKNFVTIHALELKIIETLVHIYGEINILNPYTIKNEKNFRSNLMIYDASEADIDKLINLLNEYNVWLNSNSRDKNDIIESIFIILGKLVILKQQSVGKLPDDELTFYEELFSLKDQQIKRIVELSAISIQGVLNAWNKAQKEIEEANKPKPSPLLSEEEYQRYGISIEDVSNLPENKILELNETIKEREENGTINGGTTKEKPLQYVLTSGNGFVDALVLLSIMCTEIMIGVIITVFLARL